MILPVETKEGKMKTKMLFITIIGFFLISCGKKAEEKKVEIPTKQETVEVVEVTTPSAVEVVEEVNPLSKYISDEVYDKGVEIFYGNEESMFAENTDEFSGNYDEFKTYIEGKFKPTMLITQSGTNSAVVYYLDSGITKRLMVIGIKVIEIDEILYYIKAFKDRIEIKQGKNGRSVPLYLRGR